MKRFLPLSRKSICLLVAIILILGACGGMQVKDPVKASLYTIKEEFMAVREYAVKQNLAGRLSSAQWEDYRALDNKFSALYGSTLLIYKVGVASDNVLVSRNLQQLQNLLLDIRQKFYPGL